MSRAAKAVALVLGGEPRVNLLPPEVRKERAAKVLRRQLGLGVIGTIVIVLAGTGAATAFAIQAQMQLHDEQAHTSSLVEAQVKYSEVRRIQAQVGLVEAAQQVGVSTEIDWKKYLNNVQKLLPASVTMETVTVDSATPLAIYTQATASLQGPRVATVTFTATSSVLPDVPTWLESLAQLPGFADALPSTVDLDPQTQAYTVKITMHVNDEAYAKRFAAKGK